MKFKVNNPIINRYDAKTNFRYICIVTLVKSMANHCVKNREELDVQQTEIENYIIKFFVICYFFRNNIRLFLNVEFDIRKTKYFRSYLMINQCKKINGIRLFQIVILLTM